MTYAFAWPLQQALHAALTGDPNISSMVGDRIWDEADLSAVRGGLAGPCVVIGDETASPWSTATDSGAEHRLTIEVAASTRGFGALKRLAAAVCAVATGPLTLSRGRIVSAGFLGARTLREHQGRWRRIELRFRIVIEDGP